MKPRRTGCEPLGDHRTTCAFSYQCWMVQPERHLTLDQVMQVRIVLQQRYPRNAGKRQAFAVPMAGTAPWYGAGWRFESARGLHVGEVSAVAQHHATVQGRVRLPPSTPRRPGPIGRGAAFRARRFRVRIPGAVRQITLLGPSWFGGTRLITGRCQVRILGAAPRLGPPAPDWTGTGLLSRGEGVRVLWAVRRAVV